MKKFIIIGIIAVVGIGCAIGGTLYSNSVKQEEVLLQQHQKEIAQKKEQQILLNKEEQKEQEKLVESNKLKIKEQKEKEAEDKKIQEQKAQLLSKQKQYNNVSKITKQREKEKEADIAMTSNQHTEPSIHTSTEPVMVSQQVHHQSDWVSKLNVASTTNQLVTVQVYNFKQAIVQYHIKTDGIWHQVFSTDQGWIGYGGLTNPIDRHEGNGTTPWGVYTFGSAFGAQPNPGTIFTYHRLHPDSYWDADYGTSLFNHYNTWNPGSDWNKTGAEPLWANEAVAYQYAISINYNTFNPHQGWGNAIFLHCTVGGGTAGCVGIPEHYVIYLLQHLDRQAKIVISTTNGIYNY